jgi:hypothetical protein
MHRKLVIFGLSCMIAGSLLGVLFTLAKAQVETCPAGYYLASNNLCYPTQIQPYQQQQQQQQQLPPHDSQDIQSCKIGKDAIDMDKALGVNASVIVPLQTLYNDTCGTFMK